MNRKMTITFLTLNLLFCLLLVSAPAARAQSCAAPNFAAATNFSAGDGARSVAVGDFNGDGKPDLATANFNANNVSVLLGNGAGSFGAATNFAVGALPFSVAVGDFNGDGKPDLAVANDGSDNLSVLLNGCGTAPANTAPTINATGLVRTAGATGNAQIATVTDAEDAEDTLSITATLSTGSGVTVNNLSVDASGKVTADVTAACTATNSTFTLQVTDSGSSSATATLMVPGNANQLPVLS